MTEWKLDDGRTITLVTPKEFSELPHGTVLYSIRGNRAVKGTDYIDNDTRGGYLAYGLLVEKTS
jgi:hypothetical protein